MILIALNMTKTKQQSIINIGILSSHTVGIPKVFYIHKNLNFHLFLHYFTQDLYIAFCLPRLLSENLDASLTRNIGRI